MRMSIDSEDIQVQGGHLYSSSSPLSVGCLLSPSDKLSSLTSIVVSLCSPVHFSLFPFLSLRLPFSYLWTAVFKGYHSSGKKGNCILTQPISFWPVFPHDSLLIWQAFICTRTRWQAPKIPSVRPLLLLLSPPLQCASFFPEWQVVCWKNKNLLWRQTSNIPALYFPHSGN